MFCATLAPRLAEGTDDMADLVICEKDYDTHIARVTLNCPEKRNAFVDGMGQAFEAVLDDLRMDDDIKVVLFRGADGTFSTGADMGFAYGWYEKEGDKRRPSQRRRLARDRFGFRKTHELIGFNKVTICQAETYALGLAMEILLACDVAVLGEGCQIGMPATRFLGPVLGNMHLFFYRLGTALTKEILLTGRMVEGRELDGLGIVTRVVPDAEVAAQAERFARQIAKMPADGIVIAKEAWRLVENDIALHNSEYCTYLFHAFGTNLRFEPDEFNFVSTRAKVGTSHALRLRDEFFDIDRPNGDGD
jgi:enoyl-CoA hydratase